MWHVEEWLIIATCWQCCFLHAPSNISCVREHTMLIKTESLEDVVEWFRRGVISILDSLFVCVLNISQLTSCLSSDLSGDDSPACDRREDEPESIPALQGPLRGRGDPGWNRWVPQKEPRWSRGGGGIFQPHPRKENQQEIENIFLRFPPPTQLNSLKNTF